VLDRRDNPVRVEHRLGKHSNVHMEERVLSLNSKGTLCILAGEVDRRTFFLDLLQACRHLPPEVVPVCEDCLDFLAEVDTD
jgi:hypothetical protein